MKAVSADVSKETQLRRYAQESETLLPLLASFLPTRSPKHDIVFQPIKGHMLAKGRGQTALFCFKIVVFLPTRRPKMSRHGAGTICP